MELHQKKVAGVRKHSLRMENSSGRVNVILCNDMAGEVDRGPEAALQHLLGLISVFL